MGETDLLTEDVSGDLFDDKYRVLGTMGIGDARGKLLSMGIKPDRDELYSEILIRLNHAPDYQALEILKPEWDGSEWSDIEIGLLYDQYAWYVLRGFTDGKDISGLFFESVPQGGVMIHTHPQTNGIGRNQFTHPSIIDVAYAIKKGVVYAVLSPKGVRQYTGVKKIPEEYTQGSVLDPLTLIGLAHDGLLVRVPFLKHIDFFKKWGAQISDYKWGKEANDFWSNKPISKLLTPY